MSEVEATYKTSSSRPSRAPSGEEVYAPFEVPQKHPMTQSAGIHFEPEQKVKLETRRLPPLPEIPLPGNIQNAHSNPAAAILRISQRQDQFATAHLKQVGDTLDYATQSVVKAQAEHAKKVHQVAASVAEGDFWSVLKMVANAVLGTVTIIFGGALMTTGTPMGIAAGVTTMAAGASQLLSNALRDAGKKSELTAALSMASATLGIVGSLGALFYATNQVNAVSSSILTALFGVIQATTDFGKENNRMITTQLEKEKTHLDAQLTLANHEADQLSSSATESVKTVDVAESAQRLLAAYQRNIKQINAMKTF